MFIDVVKWPSAVHFGPEKSTWANSAFLPQQGLLLLTIFQAPLRIFPRNMVIGKCGKTGYCKPWIELVIGFDNADAQMPCSLVPNCSENKQKFDPGTKCGI